MWCNNHPKEDLAKIWLLAEEDNRENLGGFFKNKSSSIHIVIFYILKYLVYLKCRNKLVCISLTFLYLVILFLLEIRIQIFHINFFDVLPTGIGTRGYLELKIT